MTWLRVDDQFAENDKVAGLHDRAFRFHVTALCYCARNLTDGVVTLRAAGIVAAILETKHRRWVAELVAAGLWIPVLDGWLVKDYLEYNPSAAKVKEDRARNAARQARHRDSNAVTDAVTDTVTSHVSNDVPSPTPPLRALALPPTPTSYEGEDSFESGDKTAELIKACGGSSDAEKKIRRTVSARRPSYETMARAIDAAKAPCESPLAVALAIIAPKRRTPAPDQRSAA